MNNRIEINIIVVSDCPTDRSALANLLFMENTLRMTEDFVAEPAEVHMEIDMLNFPNTSKLCQIECTKHNNLIMQQKKNCIKPMFFNCVKRVPNLINTGSPTDPKMNKNILLTFYFLGANYKEFDEEFSKANIIIYIGNSDIAYNELFSHVTNLVQNSNGKKYLLTISNGLSLENHSKFTILSLPKDYEDFHANRDKYLKENGFVTFKRDLASILNHQYKSMIDDNYQFGLDKMRSSMKSNPSNFIIDAEKMKNKISKLEKIFKKSYQPMFDVVVEEFLNLIDVDPVVDSVVIVSLEKLKLMYKNNSRMTERIFHTNKTLREKKIRLITNKLYCDEITVDTFLPSSVHQKFDELDDLELDPISIKKLTVHICELYTIRAKKLLSSNDNIELLYNSYFDKTQCMKMLSMLNEIISKIGFGDLKIHLIQIMITKLMIAEKCIELKNTIDQQKIDNIIIYLKSLRYFMTESKHKKYNYLFGTINDICTNFIFKINGLTQLQYLSDNINTIIGFSPDSVIKLEKFIVKTIKKNSYRDLIAVDQFDSGEDSDIDIYANAPFDFTKDDYNSEGETVNTSGLVEV